jgi:hypothetical protein
MKNVEKNTNVKKQDNKQQVYQDKTGAFLSMNEIHGKGLNFFGTNFRGE